MHWPVLSYSAHINSTSGYHYNHCIAQVPVMSKRECRNSRHSNNYSSQSCLFREEPVSTSQNSSGTGIYLCTLYIHRECPHDKVCTPNHPSLVIVTSPFLRGHRITAIVQMCPSVFTVNHPALIFVIPTEISQLKDASWVSGIRYFEHEGTHEEVLSQKMAPIVSPL